MGFAQFASDLDDATRKQLEHGERVTKLMIQKQYNPLSVALTASSLFAAEEGYLDDVDADKVTDFEAALHQYMESEQKELVDKINDTGDYSDEIKSGLHSALKEFKETH